MWKGSVLMYKLAGGDTHIFLVREKAGENNKNKWKIQFECKPQCAPNISSGGSYICFSGKSSSKSCFTLFLKRGCGKRPFNKILNGNSSGGSGDFFMSSYMFIASPGEPELKKPLITSAYVWESANSLSALMLSHSPMTSSIFLHLANAIIKSLYK